MIARPDITIDGFVGPEATASYVLVPFEVPEGVGRIDVGYEYDAQIGSNPELTGGNTVDLGLFDGRGAAFMGDGFRGWSGSERKTFTVAEAWATPGYLAGPIGAGTWNVVLGLYKVAPQGCHYRVTVRLYERGGEPVRDFPARLPLRRESSHRVSSTGWYKGELHCHSVHSDGKATPEAIIAAAQALGLDFLALMDHNALSHQVALNRIDTDLILIPGYEVTTFQGHWNIWGEGRWIDFRVTREAEMAAAIQAAAAAGYLISCNHPRPFGPDWAFPAVDGYACVEVWNGPWRFLNDHCLAFWEARLNAGQRLVAVGGSDCHHLDAGPTDAPLAQPTTYIHCAGVPSAAGLIAGLRAGHAFVTRAPDGPQLDLRSGAAMMGDTVAIRRDGVLKGTVRVVDGDGLSLELWTAAGRIEAHPVGGDDFELEWEVPAAGNAYLRAQLRDEAANEMAALTNPIYLHELD